MKAPFILSLALHVLIAGALLPLIGSYADDHPDVPVPVEPVPPTTSVDPAPVAEVTDEQLQQIDAAIEAMEQKRVEAEKPSVARPETHNQVAARASPSPAAVPANGPAGRVRAVPPQAASELPPQPPAGASKVQYASAAPLPVPGEPAVDASLPRVAVADPSTPEPSLPAGESRVTGGVRAPRVLFSNVRQADIMSLLGARQALALIDLPNKSSYLFDGKGVTLCASPAQFLALADRAITFPADSRIAAAIGRDAARPLGEQEGVEAKQLTSATVSLVWAAAVDGAILKTQRDAATALNIPFDHVAATKGSLEFSNGKFSRYRISQLQLTDGRAVLVKE